MPVVRAAGPADTVAIHQLYLDAGDRIMGMSSIRPDERFLARRLERSEAAFLTPPGAAPESRDYFFVLEDDGEVVGTSAIFAAVGLEEAFYSYRLGITVHASRELGVYRRFNTLHLSNDYTGATEIASLFVHPERTGSGGGRLVSLARMLYLAEHPDRFDERVIAEMRGFQRADGSSPFWEGLGQHFFAMPFPEADHLSAIGNKEFIAELMPRHPIYVELLPRAAREAIGDVHPSTVPARRLLESEGFSHQGYVDIFDGGPTLEGRLPELRPVRESVTRTIEVGTVDHHHDAIIIATRRADSFRATLTHAYRIDDTVLAVDPATLATLGVAAGESIRLTPFRPGRSVL